MITNPSLHTCYSVARSKSESAGMLPMDAWHDIAPLPIACVHPRSSDHHPQTWARVTWTDNALHLRFDVQDRYVICRNTEHQSSVCQDSCVEAFLKPKPDKGYINFELNAAGVMHVSYITDPTRTPTGFAQRVMADRKQLQLIEIQSALSGIIDPEITTPLAWHITCRIPLRFFELFVGPIQINSTNLWQGNFYKCADHSSHPHWLSWQPIGDELNFHNPATFGSLAFED